MIECWASMPHYADHLAPIATALDPALRGPAWAPHCVADGRAGWVPGRPRGGEMLVVASWRDAETQFHKYDRVVLVEHGAGQCYRRARANHPNRSRAEAARLAAIIGPNETVASSADLAVGCPKLDPWHAGRGPGPAQGQPVLALSTHWDSRVDPLFSGAIWSRWLDRAVSVLVAEGYEVLGHWHPRHDAGEAIRRLYDAHGVECVADAAEMLDRAHLYICDNSSTTFEFASTRRPVVLIHTPEQAAHPSPPGGRYWDWSPVGPDVSSADIDQLGAVVGDCWARRDQPDMVRIREEIVDGIYRYRDGHAAERAARAIEHML